MKSETFEQFSERHGYKQVTIKGRLVWPDGAETTDDGEWRQEPPPDRHLQLLSIRAYWVERVRRAEHDFGHARTELSEALSLAHSYSNLPAPGPGAMDLLNQLKAEYHRCHKELEKVELEMYNGMSRQQHMAEQLRPEAECKARIATTHAGVLGINL